MQAFFIQRIENLRFCHLIYDVTTSLKPLNQLKDIFYALWYLAGLVAFLELCLCSDNESYSRKHKT